MQVRMREPSGGRLAQTGVELSREARVRLAWMDFYRPCRNVGRRARRDPGTPERDGSHRRPCCFRRVRMRPTMEAETPPIY